MTTQHLPIRFQEHLQVSFTNFFLLDWHSCYALICIFVMRSDSRPLCQSFPYTILHLIIRFKNQFYRLRLHLISLLIPCAKFMIIFLVTWGEFRNDVYENRRLDWSMIWKYFGCRGQTLGRWEVISKYFWRSTDYNVFLKS